MTWSPPSPPNGPHRAVPLLKVLCTSRWLFPTRGDARRRARRVHDRRGHGATSERARRQALHQVAANPPLSALRADVEKARTERIRADERQLLAIAESPQDAGELARARAQPYPLPRNAELLRGGGCREEERDEQRRGRGNSNEAHEGLSVWRCGRIEPLAWCIAQPKRGKGKYRND